MIETKRLILRKPRLGDGPAFLPLLTDPVAMEFIGGAHPDVDADPEFPIRRWLARWEANGLGPFVVERREDGAVLGRTGFLVWDARDWCVSTLSEAGAHAQRELGWAFVRSAWGNGYATEAALAARTWGRSVFGTARLVSVVNPENRRSQRLAERLGAVPRETVELGEHGGPAVLWEHPA